MQRKISDIISTDIHGKTHRVTTDVLQWRPATYAIIVKDGQILLTRQHGKLHLPGGGLEFGEMPEDAVAREAKEETGIGCANPQLVHCESVFFTYDDGTQDVHVQSLLLFYVCDFVGGEFSIDGFEEDERQVGEMPEWIPLDQLEYIAAGSTVDWRAVVRQVLPSYF